jgi:hypothetical protein
MPVQVTPRNRAWLPPPTSLPYRNYVLGKIWVDLHESGYARPPKHRQLFTTSTEKQLTVKLFCSSVSHKGPLYHRTNFLYGSEPPTELILSSHDIHVWSALLDLPPSRVRRLQQTLVADELSRAERYAKEELRRHFIVARGALRTILGRYLTVKPEEVRFCYNAYGKPALATSSGKDALNFNVSHAHGLALYAIMRGRAIGIDLERVRTDFFYEHAGATARPCGVAKAEACSGYHEVLL